MTTATLFDTTIEVPVPTVPKAAAKKATGYEAHERHWDPRKLEVHPAQPRDVFTERQLVALRLQLERETQLEDLIARPHPDEAKAQDGWLQLLHGDRRRRAAMLNRDLSDLDKDQAAEAKELGLKNLRPWKAVRVSVRDIKVEDEAVQIVLSSHKSSVGLDVLEIARSLHWLTQPTAEGGGGYTIEAAAQVWKMDRTTASKRLKLHDLPDEWKHHARDKKHPLSGKVLQVVAAYAHCPPIMKSLASAFKEDATQFATEQAAMDCANVLIGRLGRPVESGCQYWWPSPVEMSPPLFDYKGSKDALEVFRIPFEQQLAGTTKRATGAVAFNTQLAEQMQFDAWAAEHPEEADSVPTVTPRDDDFDEDDGPDADRHITTRDSVVKDPDATPATPAKSQPTPEERDKRAEQVAKSLDDWTKRLLGWSIAAAYAAEPWESDKAAQIHLLLLADSASRNSQAKTVGDVLAANGVTSKPDILDMVTAGLPARRTFRDCFMSTVISYFFTGWTAKPTSCPPQTLAKLAATFGFDIAKTWQAIQQYGSQQDDEYLALISFFQTFKREEIVALLSELNVDKDARSLIADSTGKSATIQAILNHPNILDMPKCLDASIRRLKKAAT